MKLNFSTDISLIIESCKTTIDESKIKELISNINNWNNFLVLSYSHGVFPLVYHTLKAYSDIIPQEVLNTFKKHNMDIVKQNMLMTAELIKVMKTLEEHNIEAIAFKGPTLSQMAYGDITLRQYTDLDILVKKDTIYKILDIFSKKNYQRGLILTNSQEQAWFKYFHDLGLSSPNSIYTEFHWSILDTDHPISMSDINFFKSTQVIKLNNNPINIISNEVFLIYLCVHGSKHMFERVEWVCDIDRFIRNQNIDYSKVESILENSNYKRFVYLGIYLAQLLYNTPIDDSLSKNLRELYLQNVSSYIFAVWKNEKKLDNRNNIKLMLQLFISRTDKLRYLQKKYFKPTLSEYSYINLPRSLYFLYYPIRQYLLIKKYFINK